MSEKCMEALFGAPRWLYLDLFLMQLIFNNISCHKINCKDICQGSFIVLY